MKTLLKVETISGTSPLRKFEERSAYSNPTGLVWLTVSRKSDGMAPEKELKERSSLRSTPKSEKEGRGPESPARVPSSGLHCLERSSTFNPVISSNPVGISPHRRLFLKLSMLKSLSDVNSSGIGPVNPLSDRLNDISPVNPPITGGMGPVNPHESMLNSSNLVNWNMGGGNPCPPSIRFPSSRNSSRVSAMAPMPVRSYSPVLARSRDDRRVASPMPSNERAMPLSARAKVFILRRRNSSRGGLPERSLELRRRYSTESSPVGESTHSTPCHWQKLVAAVLLFLVFSSPASPPPPSALLD
mmetsp:Transcript_33273/g.98981  ORF Transcript_33273/g.98981 Transcript_33273/m.98981 type:complete len:301 (+) Transcript_33273:3835-4737(+)